MKTLACVGVIKEKRIIPNADKIVQAAVDCGQCGTYFAVVSKDYQVSDKVVVFLHDAILPPNDPWKFLEKNKYHIKMCMFLGAKSECLAMKPKMEFDWEQYDAGYDLTELLGVTKYEKPMPAVTSGKIIGPFFTGVAKTDEPNYQTILDKIEEIYAKFNILLWNMSDKMDGTSCTAVFNLIDNTTRVFSRNYEIEKGDNIYWNNVLKIKDEVLEFCKAEKEIIIQGEIFGKGIQGNPHKLDEQIMKIFNLKVDGVWRVRPAYIKSFAIDEQQEFLTKEMLFSIIERKKDLEPDQEGTVFRSYGQPFISFKVMNLNYKNL